MIERKPAFALALTAVLGVLLLSACQTDSREQLLKTGKSQVALRSIQSRVFDTSDRKKTLRTVIATMQDLGFVVDKADAILGSVSGTKFDRATFRLPYRLRMTVTVRPRGDSRLMVRANAQYNITPVEDPEPYQNFFNALSKAMFLDAHMVEGRVGVAAGSFGNGSPSQATAAPTSVPGGSDATKSAVAAPLPPGSIIDFEKDRPKIKQAIMDYYDQGGYDNDIPDSAYDMHGMEIARLKSLTVQEINGNQLEVSAEYVATSGSALGSPSMPRRSRFLLRKENQSFTVLRMWDAKVI